MFEGRTKKQPKLIMTKVSNTTTTSNKVSKLRSIQTTPEKSTETEAVSFNTEASPETVNDVTTISSPLSELHLEKTVISPRAESEAIRSENWIPFPSENTVQLEISRVTNSLTNANGDPTFSASEPTKCESGAVEDHNTDFLSQLPSVAVEEVAKLGNSLPETQENSFSEFEETISLSPLLSHNFKTSAVDNPGKGVTQSTKAVSIAEQGDENSKTIVNNRKYQPIDFKDFERDTGSLPNSSVLSLSDIHIEDSRRSDSSQPGRLEKVKLEETSQQAPSNSDSDSVEGVPLPTPQRGIHATVINVTSVPSVTSAIQAKKGPAPSPPAAQQTTTRDSWVVEDMAQTLGTATLNRDSGSPGSSQPSSPQQRPGANTALIKELKQYQQTHSGKDAGGSSPSKDGVDGNDNILQTTETMSGKKSGIQKQMSKDSGMKDTQINSAVKQKPAPGVGGGPEGKQNDPESFETYKLQRGRKAEMARRDSKESTGSTHSPRSSVKGKAPPAPTQNVVMNGSVRRQSASSPQRPASSKRQAPDPQAGKDAKPVAHPWPRPAQILQSQALYHQNQGVTYASPHHQHPHQHHQQQQLQQYIFRDHARQIQESRYQGRPVRSLSQPRVVRAPLQLQQSWDDWSIPRVATTTNAFNGKNRPTSQQLSFRSSQLVLSVYGDPTYGYTVIEQPPPMSITPMARTSAQIPTYRLAAPMSARTSRSDIPGQPKSILKNNANGMVVRGYKSSPTLGNGYMPAQGSPDVYFSSTKNATSDGSGDSPSPTRQGDDVIPGAFRTLSASKKSPPLKKKQMAQSAGAPTPRRSSSAGSNLSRYDMGSSMDEEPKRKTVTFNKHVQLHHGNQISTIASLPVDT